KAEDQQPWNERQDELQNQVLIVFDLDLGGNLLLFGSLQKGKGELPVSGITLGQSSAERDGVLPVGQRPLLGEIAPDIVPFDGEGFDLSIIEFGPELAQIDAGLR